MDVDTSDYVLVSSRALSGGKPETICKIIDWLEPTDSDSPASEYRKHLNSHVPGTGQWILDTDQYRQWFEGGDQGALWIRGIPGSGKSVVAASLVRKLQLQAEFPVLFFFFREIIMSNRTPQALLRDFARGLLPRCPSLQSGLKLLMEEHPKVEAVPFDGLWRCVSLGLAAMPKVYCVVDALDEMETGHVNFIRSLIDLANQHPSSIKLVLTSRQILFHENHFQGTSGLVDLRLDRQHVDNDIATYITYRLNTSQPPVSPDQAAAIKVAFCSKGKGLFLYARLMMEQLLAQPQDIMSRLADLPDGLRNMYTEILREHAIRSGTSSQFQLLVLQWITHSVRPLRLLELATAIQSLPDRGGLRSDQDAKGAVQSSCGPLLELCEDGVLQIIHHSLTEFLRDPELSHARSLGPQAGMQSVDSNIIHGHIASTCIDYVLTVCVNESNAIYEEDGSQSDESFSRNLKESFRRYPFLRYAAKFWPSHASRATDANQTLFAKMDEILSPEKSGFEFWKEVYLDWDHRDVNYSARPLHLAAFCGLDYYVKNVILRETDVNMADRSGRTPLVYAAMQNHVDVVRTLLRHGAAHDIPGNSGLTPLHYAAQRNHVESLRALLEGGADPLASKSKENDRFNPQWNDSTIGETALLQKYVESHIVRNGPIHWAAKAGKASILHVLDANGNTPLYLAACEHESAAVRTLLDHGADVRTLSWDTRSHRNSERMVSSRIRTTEPQRCYTPLHGWAHLSGFYSQVVRLLVAAGCDVNARDHLGQTALFVLKKIASYRAKEEDRAVATISVLATHGADASVVDYEGNSVLHLLESHIVTESVLRLLIEAGSDINAKRIADGKTALMIQAVASLLAVDLKPFHTFGADFDIQDADGNTAAHLAANGAMRSSRLAQSWVAIANPSLRNNSGQTVLHSLLCSSGVDRPGLISSMVEKGFSLESQDHRGRTALLTFVDGQRWSDSNEVLLGSLLGLGANPRATDYQGKSALHLIAVSVVSFIDAGRSDVEKKKGWMKQLIDAGADIRAVDHTGNTVLHDSMAWRESWRMVQSSVHAAVELESPVQACNHQGRNILHLAALADDSTRSEKQEGKDGMATRLGFALQAHIGLDINGPDHEGITPLHLASTVSEQNTRRLVQSGADFRLRTNNHETPLHSAARACQSNIVGYLLELYQGNLDLVNARNLTGRTALHEAARNGRQESVKLLLDAGANPTIQDARGRSALHAAGEFEARSCFSSEGSQPKKDTTKDNSLQRMRVMIETEDGSKNIREVVRLLVNSGADPAQLDNEEHTPTDVALMHGSSAVVEELAPRIQAIYSRSDGDGDGLSPVDPLGESLYNNSSSALRWVDDFSVPKNHRQLLERAISTGNELLVEKLVRTKRLRLIEDDGTSALCFAVRWGCVSMMRRLVPYSGDLNSCSPPLLIVAAERRLPNIEMIKLLVECGVDPNAQYTDEKYRHGVTATHILARGKHWWNVSGLACLLDAGGDTEVKTLDGKTPLHTALESGDSGYSSGEVWPDRTLQVLVQHGADVNATTSEGVAPLHTALSNQRDGDTLALLLSSGADPSLGDTPAIFSALRARDPSALKVILQAGIDPNLVHKPRGKKRRPKKVEEQTPLELAASPSGSIDLRWTDIIAAHEQCISLLLDHGANPNLPLRNGLSTPLHEICSLNGLIKPIIRAGCDLEQRDADGRTPLHRSCIGSFSYPYDPSINKEYASLQLVESGVSVHVADDTGSTALHYAAQHGMRSTVKALLAASASPAVKNNAGFTPFYYALLKPRCDIINALLDAGANPLERGPDGRTALHFLAPCLMEYDYTSLYDDSEEEEEDDDENEDEDAENLTRFGRLYRRLVASGCDRSARDNDGNTPLFAYVATVKLYHEDVETPRPPTAADMGALFAEHDVQARNNKGETLLHVVAQRDDLDNALVDAPEIFTALVERGLSPWTEDGEGATALDVAAAFEQDEILALYARDE
ncbi:ankyrin repeat-containing domain protein [Aspergillus candidus]|uniref:Ankyrin repeat-containing domain protein n=1 Tax=Aspergillus candidus TaxID=41067 RepID=A0A2I2FKD1_ASPCN|nr:ankyrin repeat-containing domain protein [Aspergillus candidus]PLB41064.1 ankyrin repeat-containing domain protein [Aspergillus candidus]